MWKSAGVGYLLLLLVLQTLKNQSVCVQVHSGAFLVRTILLEATE